MSVFRAIVNYFWYQCFVQIQSDHCLLGGEGAKAFAVANGMQLVDDKELITEKARIRWNEIKEFVPSVEDEFIKGSRL